MLKFVIGARKLLNVPLAPLIFVSNIDPFATNSLRSFFCRRIVTLGGITGCD
jgi:hypothetical protein